MLLTSACSYGQLTDFYRKQNLAKDESKQKNREGSDVVREM
jgi:hypothetical protein